MAVADPGDRPRGAGRGSGSSSSACSRAAPSAVSAVDAPGRVALAAALRAAHGRGAARRSSRPSRGRARPSLRLRRLAVGAVGIAVRQLRRSGSAAARRARGLGEERPAEAGRLALAGRPARRLANGRTTSRSGRPPRSRVRDAVGERLEQRVLVFLGRASVGDHQTRTPSRQRRVCSQWPPEYGRRSPSSVARHRRRRAGRSRPRRCRRRGPSATAARTPPAARPAPSTSVAHRRGGASRPARSTCRRGSARSARSASGAGSSMTKTPGPDRRTRGVPTTPDRRPGGRPSGSRSAAARVAGSWSPRDGTRADAGGYRASDMCHRRPVRSLALLPADRRALAAGASRRPARARRRAVASAIAAAASPAAAASADRVGSRQRGRPGRRVGRTRAARPTAAPPPTATDAARRRSRPDSAACGRRTASPASRPRSCSPTGRCGAARAASRTSDRRRPVTPDTDFAVASISKTFPAALILTLVEEGRLVLDAPVVAYLPDLRDRPDDHRPPAARPHERPARLLPRRPGIDEALLARPRRSLDRRRVPRLRRQAVLQAGHGLALLEHELRDPRAARGGDRRRPAGRPAPDPLPRPARPRPHLLPGRRAARSARSRTATASTGRADAAGRSTCRDGTRRSCRSPRS